MAAEPNPAPLTIALRARAAEAGSGTSLAILLRNAADEFERVREERQFFDHQSRRYEAALSVIRDSTTDESLTDEEFAQVVVDALVSAGVVVLVDE